MSKKEKTLVQKNKDERRNAIIGSAIALVLSSLLLCWLVNFTGDFFVAIIATADGFVVFISFWVLVLTIFG